MLKKYSFIAFIFLSIACSSDNEKVKQEDKIQPIKSELPDGFSDFYEQFHSDSAFQLSHVIFPLKGVNTMIDTMSQTSIDVEYLPENWKLHIPFVHDAGYNRSFTVLGDLVIESINDNMGLLNIERRWGIIDKDWNLIYYSQTQKTWQ